MRAWVLVGIVVGTLGVTPVAAVAATADTIGVVDTTTGVWYLRDGGGATTSFYYGNPGDSPFMGDWDCDGVDTPGLYRRADGFVYLRDANSQGVADVRFFFGNPGDLPVAGDFDGDGCDTVSLFRPSTATVFIINELGSDDAGLGPADYSFALGTAGEQPVAGDYDLDGIDEVAMYDRSTATLQYIADAGDPVSTVAFGNPGDLLVVGDWAGSGDGLGAYRPSEGAFYVGGAPVAYGNAALVAIAGRFGTLPGGGDEPPPLPAVAVPEGSSGPLVTLLQQLLTERGFYRGAVDGSYGAGTRQAVMAFHKDQGLTRSWDWQGSDWARLAAYTGPDITDRPDEPYRMEIDLTKQVAYLVEGGVGTGIVPVSSGNGALFEGKDGQMIRARTPRGDFTFDRHIAGLRVSYLGVLYKPWYFRGGYAIHGSPSVPGYPASHGCVRIPNWEADWMDDHLFIGMPVHVYG